jgi:hypothetical protein
MAEVKPRTPVDTGDLRNHWQVGRVFRVGDTLSVQIVNSMYYASYVEYGHAKPYKSGAGPGSVDWVEGYFMMTVSEEKIRTTMPRRFESALATYLKGLGAF